MCNENQKTREPQYTALINVRNTELAAYWTRYNIQAVLNFGLLAAALSSKSDSLINRHIFPVAIVGLLLSTIWLLMTIWSKKLITQQWDKYIRQYENKYPNELFQLFVSVEVEENKKEFWNGLTKHWKNLNILTRVVPLILMVVWLVIIYASTCNPSLLKSQEEITVKSEIQNLSIKIDEFNSALDHLKGEISEIKSKRNNQTQTNKMISSQKQK
jgi:hypothetical protein